LLFKELKKEYLNKNITKANYIKKAYSKFHNILISYSKILDLTTVEKITIVENELIFTIRENGLLVKPILNDHRSAPFEILNFGDYEKKELNITKSLFKDGQTFLDIGSNIGWYSLNIANYFNNSKIYAFEPMLMPFEIMNENVKLNNFKNIKTFNYGLSDYEQLETFYYYPEGTVNASLKNLQNKAKIEKKKIMVYKLDSVVRKNDLKVDFIKCDVEGAEINVLRGGLETIKKDKPILFLEILRKWTKKFDYDSNDIIEILQSLGYSCFVIRNNSLKKINKITKNTIDTNFFFLNEIKHKSLIKKFSKNY
jgi:FkbM family methyltransferase